MNFLMLQKFRYKNNYLLYAVMDNFTLSFSILQDESLNDASFLALIIILT